MDTRRPSAARRPAPQRGTLQTNRRTSPAMTRRGQPASVQGTGGDLSTVVLTDVSGSAQRDQPCQRWMRHDLYEIVRDVVRYVGLDLNALQTTDTGDGLRLHWMFVIARNPSSPTQG